jgi:hypothetical protein
MAGPVDNAVNTIKSNLDQGIFDWDVTHGELLDNNKKVIELTPEQRNELISKLSDDDLKNWTQEIDGLSGALTASERQELFNKLAEGVDGEQLTRLVKAFDGSPGGREALGTAVAQHGSSEAKVAFLEATKGSINGDYKATQGRDGNAEAVVAAKVLGSLGNDPGAFDKAVKSLNEAGKLEAVITVGLGRNHVAAANTSRTYFEPSATVGILNAAAKSSDPEVKGLVFKAATEQFDIVEGSTADKPLTDALSKLVDSDPNGLVNELQSRSDITGKSLVAYTTEMLESGKEQDLRNQLVRLQQGNDGTGSAFENFSDPKTARNVGFFLGATAAGINDITDNAESQGDLLKNIFGAGFGAAGAVNPPAGAIASVGNGITAITIDNIVDGVKDGNKELKQALYELAIPRGPDNVINMQGTGYDAFNASFGAVAEVNR